MLTIKEKLEIKKLKAESQLRHRCKQTQTTCNKAIRLCPPRGFKSPTPVSTLGTPFKSLTAEKIMKGCNAPLHALTPHYSALPNLPAGKKLTALLSDT